MSQKMQSNSLSPTQSHAEKLAKSRLENALENDLDTMAQGHSITSMAPKNFSEDTLNPNATIVEGDPSMKPLSPPPPPPAKTASDDCRVPNLPPMDLVRMAETSADDLMDQVFEDVDYMLDRGGSLAPRTSQSAVMPSEQKDASQDSQNHSLAAVMPAASHPALPNDDNRATALADDESMAPNPAPVTNQWNHAIRLAFPILGASAALGLTLAVGLILYGPKASLQVSDAGDITGVATSDHPHGEFADYMERALDVMLTDETNEPPGLNGSNGANSDDSSSTFPTAPESLNPSLGIPQRVYIPVYQPPQPSLSSLPTVPIQGSASSPTASPPLAPPEGNADVTPEPLPPDPPEPVTEDSSSPVVSELSHDHVLVGLLQLGDRSVAMFDFSEGTHRVKVGEQIGTSGWSLVSVAENEAIIRRNGEVRSIYIGQSF